MLLNWHQALRLLSFQQVSSPHSPWSLLQKYFHIIMRKIFGSIDSDLLRECRAILTVYLGSMLAGYNMGFSAVAIPDITQEMISNSTYSYSSILPSISATKEQLSWFGINTKNSFRWLSSNLILIVASSVNIGQMIGCLLGGYLGSQCGPKRTIQLSCVLGVLGWLCITLAPHLSLLIIGRIICGCCSAFSSSNCSLLVAQYRQAAVRTLIWSHYLTTLISSVKWRGAFLSLFALMVGIGILFSYVLGSFLYWRLVSSVPTVLGYILLGTGLISVPESPIWLLSHRGVDQARQSLLWLRYEDDGEIL